MLQWTSHRHGQTSRLHPGPETRRRLRSPTPSDLVDAYRTTVEVDDYPLEELAARALIVHAVDDPPTSYDAAVAAVSRIPDGRLVSLDAGGHLLVGQTGRLSRELDAFLATYWQRANPIACLRWT